MRPFCFLAGAAAPAPDTNLDVDFSALANGGHSAASFLSATGLTFTRATGSATVQTSASALTSGIAADYARVGSNDGSSKGLVMEPGNILDQGVGYDPRAVSGGGINAGTATRTAAAATGPDGTASAATQFNASSGQYAHYFGPITDGAYAWSQSCWQRSVTSDDCQMVYNIAAAVDTGGAVTSAGSTTWRRLFQKVKAQSGNNKYSTPVDARDYSSVGGQAATARNVYVDYYNLPRNVFPMEAVIVDQDPDLLSHTAVEDFISSGEINVEFAFRPLHDSDDPVYHTGGSFGAPVAQTYYYLWRVDATHYCRIVAATMLVEIKNGASTFTSTYALDWVRDDLVELFVECGDTGTPTVTARINSGTAFTLGGSGTIPNFSSTGQIDFCCDTTASTVADDYSVVTARHVRLKTYSSGDAPAWISGASAWTPALFDASGYWRGSYAGAPWADTPTAGVSATTGDLVAGASSPTTGAAQNGYTPADFNGTSEYLTNATATSTIWSAGAGTILALINADAAPAAKAAQPYDDAVIIGDSAGNMGLCYVDNGGAPSVNAFVYPGTYVEKTVACGASAYHLIMVRWDGDNLGVTVDSGAESTIACGDLTLAGTLVAGTNYAAAAFYAGLSMELMTADVAYSKTGYRNFKAYCNSRYSLAL